MNISYETFEEFPGWDEAPVYLEHLIREQDRPLSVLEIGAGANPTLSPQALESLEVEYTANDIDPAELDKADPIYHHLALDLSAPELDPAHHEQYDLIFSRMVNEHVHDGQQYFQNIHKLLRPGGITAHCFSTLYALPFVVNRIVPETVSDYLLNLFNPRDRYQHDKFRAYYSWSRGPSARSIERFESLGFRIVDYRGYFGHNYYDSRLPVLGRLERMKAKLLCRTRPIPSLTSYATLVMEKDQ